MDQKQRVGRPRAQQRSSDGPVEEEILAAAGKLFRLQGISATSTRQIAEETGLRQPTLFHYFKNKAAIISEIANRAIEPETKFLQAEEKANDSPDVALYRYVHFVVYNLHTNPHVIGSPQKYPELTRSDYPGFWEQYDRVQDNLKRLLKKGIEADLFVTLDTQIAAQQLFALMEYVLNQDGRNAALAKKAADTAALLVLRAVLSDVDRVDVIAKDANHPPL